MLAKGRLETASELLAVFFGTFHARFWTKVCVQELRCQVHFLQDY